MYFYPRRTLNEFVNIRCHPDLETDFIGSRSVLQASKEFLRSGMVADAPAGSTQDTDVTLYKMQKTFPGKDPLREKDSIQLKLNGCYSLTRQGTRIQTGLSPVVGPHQRRTLNCKEPHPAVTTGRILTSDQTLSKMRSSLIVSRHLRPASPWLKMSHIGAFSRCLSGYSFEMH